MNKTNKLSLGILIAFDVLITITSILIIQSLQSEGKYFLAISLIPILITFNYVFFNIYVYRGTSDFTRININKKTPKRIPILKLNGREYSFSHISILILFFFCPILSYLIFLFFNLRVNNWLQEIMAKQTALLLYVFFNIDTKVLYVPHDEYPWIIFLYHNQTTYRISNQCTGIHIFSIFIAIIICTPKSNSLGTSEQKNIIWRKFKIFNTSLVFFYAFNLIRMVILIYLDNIGFSFTIIHRLINNLSGILAAVLFVIFLWMWLPEFFISFYYFYLFLKNKYYN